MSESMTQDHLDAIKKNVKLLHESGDRFPHADMLCLIDEIERLQSELASFMVDRNTEAWQHAACLSIAEGAPGWENPVNQSVAMMKVIELRKKYDASQARVKELEDAREQDPADIESLKDRIEEFRLRAQAAEKRVEELEGETRRWSDAWKTERVRAEAAEKREAQAVDDWRKADTEISRLKAKLAEAVIVLKRIRDMQVEISIAPLAIVGRMIGPAVAFLNSLDSPIETKRREGEKP